MLGGHGGENALSEEDKDRIEQSFTEDVREIEEKYGSNVCCGLCCPFWKCGEYSVGPCRCHWMDITLTRYYCAAIHFVHSLSRKMTARS